MTKAFDAQRWVRLATLRGDWRPVLTAVHVTDTAIEATDGMRAHRVSGESAFRPGLWHAKTNAPVEGNWPQNFNTLMDGGKATHRVKDQGSFVALVQGAAAAQKAIGSMFRFPVALPGGDGYVTLQARFVAEAIAPFVGGEIRYRVDDGRCVRFDLRAADGQEATALIMGFHQDSELHKSRSPRFDLAEFVEEIEA